MITHNAAGTRHYFITANVTASDHDCCKTVLSPVLQSIGSLGVSLLRAGRGGGWSARDFGLFISVPFTFSASSTDITVL
jgi:hypothetical protein